MKKPTRPCRHQQQAVGDFLFAFPHSNNPEKIGYCWSCGSLKRQFHDTDNNHWQYTLHQERIRAAWATKRKAGKGSKKR